MEEIEKATRDVGLDVKKAYKIPFTALFEKAIEIGGQAQFDPLRYVKGLLKTFIAGGGHLFKETSVIGYKHEDNKICIECSPEEIFRTANLIFATHVPPGNNRFNMLTAPYRSYVVTLELENPHDYAQAADLYDPYHYFRYHTKKDTAYLIVGGFDHKTGQEEDTEKVFEDLMKYADENFKYKKAVAQWSSQYYTPADGLPYIGAMPGEENVYISTGYDGDGMTWSAIAAMLIPDLIEGKDNSLAEIVSPGRVTITSSAKSVITESADNLLQLVKGKFQKEKIESLNEIGNGEGKIITYEGQKIAAYKSEKGELTLLSPRCTHQGCDVAFNSSEKTWDCPCHGSRFGTDGNVLNGPAQQNLEKIQE